jgi:hypothetical protein
MPPTRTTKPNLSSRFTPLGDLDGSESAVDRHQDSAGKANTGAGPSWSGHDSMDAVAGLHPVGSLTRQFRPAVRPSKSGNNIVPTFQYSALLTPPSNRYLLQQPLHPPPPGQRFYEPTSFFPKASSQPGPSWSLHSTAPAIPNSLPPVGGTTSQYHTSRPPVHPSRRENNIGDSLQADALWTFSDQDIFEQPPHLLLPARPSHYNTTGCASAHGGTTSFFPDASAQSRLSWSAHPVAQTVPYLFPPSSGSTSQSHKSWPPVRPTWSENNIESSQFAANALSMPSNERLQQSPHKPCPAPHWSYDNLAVSTAHEATTSFLAGASGFHMHDINHYEASHITVNRGGSASDSSNDGKSKFIFTEELGMYHRNLQAGSCF